MAGNPKRFVGIDVLRALAVIGVLAGHLAAIALFISPSGLLRPPQGVLEWTAWKLSTVGDYGVVLFFAISGFVITRTVLQRDGDLRHMRVGAFYVRRIARIWPALILSLALGIAALLTASRSSPAAGMIIFGNAPFTATFWLSIATFTFSFLRFHAVLTHQDWGYHWNVLWSLSVEEQFYLFFPLLASRAATRRQLFAALAMLVAVGVASRLALRNMQGIWILLTPNCVDALALGVAAAVIPRFRINREWAVRGAVFGLAILIMGSVCGSRAATPLIIAVAVVLIMLCVQNGAVFTGRIWRPLARIGRVSYGMYLFHPLVLWGLLPWLHGMSFLSALSVFIAATVLAAEISFAVVERPASAWILNCWSAPRTRTGASVEMVGVGRSIGAEPVAIRASDSD